MSDDVCGYPTADGEPCQHPTTEEGDPDRCYIDSHNEADVPAEQQPGPPTKFEERREEILTGAQQGMTIEGCARLAGVHKQTLYNWLDEYSEFESEFLRARAHGELKHIRSVNDNGSQFLLERSYGYTKQQEIEHTGDGFGDVVVSFSDADTQDPDE